MKQTLKLTINGMRCMHCASHVTDAIKALKGVKKVNVDLDSKTAIVLYKTNDSEGLVKEIQDAITELGFELVSVENEK